MSLDHPDDVSDVRQFMAKQGIPPRPISINEFQYSEGKHRPGLTVWWLAHMETEAPESASYACWPDPAGYSDCDSPTLDGLLTRDGEPRAVWFAHKGYADITGLLVEVGVSEAGIAGIAGANEAVQTARLILGRKEISHGSEGTEVEVVFRNLDLVSYLGEEGKVFVRAARIPDSGTASLEGYEVAMADECLVRDNEVRVRLRDFGAWEAYTVVLGREARSDSEWHSIKIESFHMPHVLRERTLKGETSDDSYETRIFEHNLSCSHDFETTPTTWSRAGPRTWTWHQNRRIRSTDEGPNGAWRWWSAILKGETSVGEAARTHGLTVG